MRPHLPTLLQEARPFGATGAQCALSACPGTGECGNCSSGLESDVTLDTALQSPTDIHPQTLGSVVGEKAASQESLPSRLQVGHDAQACDPST